MVFAQHGCCAKVSCGDVPLIENVNADGDVFSFCFTLAKRYRSFVATAYFEPFEKNQSRFSEVIFSSGKEATFQSSGLFISFCTNIFSEELACVHFPRSFSPLFPCSAQRTIAERAWTLLLFER